MSKRALLPLKLNEVSGRIAVAESWAFFIGSTFNRSKYIGTPALATAELNFLEFQKRDDNVPVAGFSATLGYSQGWIPWGMLHDLGDAGEPAITLIDDQVDAYAIPTIFSAFTTSATDIPSLRTNLLERNSYRQQTAVENLVNSYGW